MIPLKNKQGWLTVFASFVVQSLTHGLSSSFGVFYVKWREEFPSNSTEVSILVSSVLAVILCTSPFSGAAVRHYGERSILTIGGVVSFAGLVLSSVVKKFWLLFLTISLMVGVGSGLCYMAVVIAVSHHFQKNFATAIGIATIGASMGMIVMTVLFETLTDYYGWRGAILIIAGLQSHVFVCAALMQPPRRTGYHQKIKSVKFVTRSNAESASVKNEHKSKDSSSSVHWETTLDGSRSGIENDINEGNKSHKTSREQLQVDKVDFGCPGNMLQSIPYDNFYHLNEASQSQDFSLNSAKQVKQNSNVIVEERYPPAVIQCATCQGCIESLLMHLSFIFHSCIHLVNIPLLWKVPPFSAINLASFFGATVYGTVLPLIKAKGLSHGIPSLEASLFMSMIGVGNILSRITYGRLVDNGLIHPVVLFALSYLIATVSCLVMALSSTLFPLLLASVGEGIAAGLYISLPVPVLRDIIGKENLPGAYGLNLLAVGIGNIFSATVSGYLLDKTNNFTIVFLLPTTTVCIACSIVFSSHLYWGVLKNDPRWPKKVRKKDIKTENPAAIYVQNKGDDEGNSKSGNCHK